MAADFALLPTFAPSAGSRCDTPKRKWPPSFLSGHSSWLQRALCDLSAGVADALAAAAALLENRFWVTEIGGGKVVSDQLYAYSSGVNENGEWHRQTQKPLRLWPC